MPEYEVNSEILLPINENGKQQAKKMKVVEVKLSSGKFVYKVKRGGESEPYKDKDGNDWFKEDELEWSS